MVIEDWEKAALEFDGQEKNDDILISEMEKYLDARKNKKIFIETETKISFCLVEKLQKLRKIYGLKEVIDCVERTTIEKMKNHHSSGLNFYVETSCDICGEVYQNCITKSKFIELISEKINFTCPSCEKEKKIKQKQESEKFVENDRKIILENTFHYIETYLNPTFSWKKNLKVWEKIQSLQSRYVNANAIYDHIKAMDYQDFLKTPYWKAITQKKMKDANFRCQLCNAEKVQLSTHHRTYSIHGAEIFNLKELIVLCQDCHGKHHDHHKPD